MTKYHINPTSGEPGLCTAEISCKFNQGEEDHYSKEEIQRASEQAWQSVGEEFDAFSSPTPEEVDTHKKYAFLSSLANIKNAKELRPVAILLYGDRNDVRNSDPSLKVPDIDYGFHWSTPDSNRGGRVSLAKYMDDPTGTLYVESADGKIAVLAHGVSQEKADSVWREMLNDNPPGSGRKLDPEDLLERLKKN